MINGNYLRLLIIEESENDAESLANTLRNDGHSIRFDYARTTDGIESALDGQIADIVLCGSGEDVVSVETVQNILAQRSLSTPVFTIVDEAPEAVVVAAKISGVTAVVSYDQPDHLQLAVAKEINLLQLQHRVAELDAAFTDCEKRCQTLIEGSSDAVAYIHEGMHCFANQPYMKLFGINSREEVEGIPILDMISKDERDTFKRFLRAFQKNNGEENILKISCINGNQVDFESTMDFTPASHGGEPCTQIIIRSNNALNSELEEKIEAMTREDSLTGLSNRQHFMALLDKNVHATGKTEGIRALIYITLDKFKVIREENGITASDAVLCDIAKLLELHCNESDFLSRFGDYSYALLYHASSNEQIQCLGEKILHDISSHMSEVNGQAVTMTCSIGICAINERSTDAQKILTQADTACEVARSSGGNQIHTHSGVLDEQVSEVHEKEWDKVIRETIDEQRFYLAYQPIVSLIGDNNRRYEALLRIVDEAGNTILPAQFLAIAEKSGFSAEIDRWVFETVFKRLLELDEDNKKTTIFIKLSAATLSDTNSPTWIFEKLKEYQIDKNSVTFQIQEIDAANDLKNAISFVRAMRDGQCKVALEHYGSGNQPQLLKHVPADIVKIDGKLIQGIVDNNEYQSRVNALVTLAHEHDKKCIAESVDNPAILAILWRLGVDMMQGDFVQEPDRELTYDFEGEIA